MENRIEGLKQEGEIMLDIVVQEYPESPAADAYRSIRANIRFADPENTIKTIVVTSAGYSEGKTTTVVNLAASMAGLGKKVLVIDCDLRTPEIHKHFHISNRSGILDAIFEGEEALQVMETESGFDIVSSGRKRERASEMLDSNEMRRIIQTFRSRYDYVFIDTAPLGEVVDAAVLATMADGVILVCASGKTKLEKVERAKLFLEQVNAKILGVVVNNATDERAYNYEETVVEKIKRLFSSTMTGVTQKEKK